MKYKDLFIDFDDTIYDTRGNAELALAELFSAEHLDRHFATLDDFTIPYWKANTELWEQYSRGEISRDHLIVERFRKPLSYGHDINPTTDYCLRISDHFLDLCSCKPGIIEGARELLNYLHGRYHLHICSNGFHEVQYKKLTASDTLQYFDTIILSEDAGVNKPAKEFFDFALQKAHAESSTTLMIGDNLNTDILGAQRAGIDTLYFNRWQTDESPGVTFRVDTLKEILNIL